MSGTEGLRDLDVSRNQLMVLDLRGQRALQAVNCSGNDLGLIVLDPAAAALQRLDVSRNQLMTLDLGDPPALRVVRCDRNALAHLCVGAAPVLEVIDAAHNDLGRLDLGPLPALRVLSISHNRLGSCHISDSPALRELRCRSNYIGELDLGRHPGLQILDAGDNQLERVRFGPSQELVEVDLSGNRLSDLALASRSLQVLDCARNHLRRIALRGVPELRALDCSHNPLDRVDLAAVPDLIALTAVGTRAPALDIRANPALARLRTRDDQGHGPKIEATPDQQRALREIRTVLGLGTGSSAPEDLDAYELHDLALSITGRNAEQRLLAIVRAPRCDLGTALMIYWTSSPHYFRRYNARSDVPPYELPGWDLLAAIEARAQGEGFQTAAIPFDPTDDRQTRSVRGIDWTRPRTPSPHAALRELPVALSSACTGRGASSPGS